MTTFAYDETGALAGQVRASGVEAQIDRDLAGRVTFCPPGRCEESASRQGIVIARTPDELIAILKELAR